MTQTRKYTDFQKLSVITVFSDSLRKLGYLLKGRIQYLSDARMWIQCTPQKLDIVSAVSSLYLNNLASLQKADHFSGGRDMSGITYKK